MAARVGVLTLLLLAFPGIIRPTAACGCMDNPSCSAVWKADAVFVGTVTERRMERIAAHTSWQLTEVAVSQRLRGEIEASVSLVPSVRMSPENIAAAEKLAIDSVTSSTCDYDFEVGRAYIVYATRTPDGRWTTSKCTGTKPLEEALEDLDYIASIPLFPPTGRVTGRIERAVLDPDDPNGTLAVPASDVTVALSGEASRLTVTTDESGQFDVQVPPGEYSVAPEVAETIRVYGAPMRVAVPARGCAPVYFSMSPNGRIAGRVVRSNGTPAARVSVRAFPEDVPVDQLYKSRFSGSAATDESGRFLMDGLFPGRYVISVNVSSGPTLQEPYLTTYAPGVARAEARVIDVREGQHHRNVDIVVTSLAETTITGWVVFDDGQPVSNARVMAKFVDSRNVGTSTANTDSAGVFRLRVLKGLSYRLAVSSETWPLAFPGGEFVIAPEQAKEGVRLTIQR